VCVCVYMYACLYIFKCVDDEILHMYNTKKEIDDVLDQKKKKTKT